MLFNFKLKCFNCGYIDNYRFLNEYSSACPHCHTTKIDFEVRVEKDENGYDPPLLLQGWKNNKLKQNVRVGDYYFNQCKSCGFNGILHKEQNFCPKCTKKPLVRFSEASTGFGTLQVLWNECLKYLSKATKEDMMKDAIQQNIIFQTREGLPEPLPLEVREPIIVQMFHEETENSLIERPIIEELYDRKS